MEATFNQSNVLFYRAFGTTGKPKEHSCPECAEKLEETP